MDIKAQSCTCKRWDLSGVPCHHAIACCREERISPEELVAPCYSIEHFKLAYKPIIKPCRDTNEWVRTNQCEIKPPLYDKRVGRPTNRSRRKQPYELQTKSGAKRMTKHGIIITCSYCQQDGHNKAGCGMRKVGILPKLPVRRRSRAIPEDVSGDEEQAAE